MSGDNVPEINTTILSWINDATHDNEPVGPPCPVKIIKTDSGIRVIVGSEGAHATEEDSFDVLIESRNGERHVFIHAQGTLSDATIIEVSRDRQKATVITPRGNESEIHFL